MGEARAVSAVSGPAPSVRAVAARLRAAGCVFAEEEARLLIAAVRTPAELAAMVERRSTGVPLEQLLGWAEFCGLRIVVEAGVFVPRRRTGFLVSAAVGVCRPGAVVVDLCCGSGAVAAALAAACPQIEVYAADVDPAAVRCARRNLAPHDGRVFEGDLFDPLPAALRGRVDVLVSNAPYVPTASIAMMPPEARIYEARAALDGGPDGLDVQRRVAGAAQSWLAPEGVLLLETSEHQGGRTAGIFAANGLIPRIAQCADLEATVVTGSRSREPTPWI